MSCFGDGTSGTVNESLADSGATAATGIPGQTTTFKKICGGGKRRAAAPYYADNRTFDPYSTDYMSQALQEMDYNPPDIPDR